MSDIVIIRNNDDGWYRCYNNSAKIVSFLTNYILFTDNYSQLPAVGFPQESLNKVVYQLRTRKINYYVDDGAVPYRDFGEENNYLRYLAAALPYCDIVKNENSGGRVFSNPSRDITYAVTLKMLDRGPIPVGRFKVQYEGDEPEEFVIGENISGETELAQKVMKAKVGDTITINEFKVLVLEKEMELEDF